MGCLRSLERGWLRNTQNSIGTSRSVLDPSWFGLRPIPLRQGLPDTSGTRKIQKAMSMHDSTANHACWDFNYNLLLNKNNVSNFTCRPSSRFTLRPSHPRNVQKCGHFPCCLRESISVQLPEIRRKLNEHLHILFQHAKPHVQNNVYETCHERLTYNLCSCNAPEGNRTIFVI